MNIQRAIAKARWYIQHQRIQTATYTDIVNILEASVNYPADPCEYYKHDLGVVGESKKARKPVEIEEMPVTIPINLARRFLNAEKMRWDEQWAMLSEMEKVIKEQLK